MFRKIRLLILVTAFTFLFTLSTASAQTSETFTENWIEQNNNLATSLSNTSSRLSSSITDAMRKVPRHVFLDASYENIAYENISLPGYGGGILPSPADTLAAVDMISPTSTDNLLIAGNNAGYAAAILSRLAEKVYLIEETPVADAYREIFAELGFDNIIVSEQVDINSFSEIIAFDRIFIHGSVSQVSEQITERLSIQGNITFILATPGGFQQIISLRRSLLGDRISCGGSCFFPEIKDLKVSN